MLFIQVFDYTHGHTAKAEPREQHQGLLVIRGVGVVPKEQAQAKAKGESDGVQD